jgi:hypothetical protein
MFVTLTVVLCSFALFPGIAAARHRTNHGLLSFSTMFGVDGAYVEEANAIRGVAGDELPWEVEGSATGRLTETGRLVITVRGLVFKSAPPVPRELWGKNDEAEFRALVSCLDDTASVVNVVTAGFPATRVGDSDIDAQLQLPETCVAPLVFVLSGSEDKWFSVTGMEAE